MGFELLSWCWENTWDLNSLVPQQEGWFLLAAGVSSPVMTVVTLQRTPFFWWWTTVFVSISESEILAHTTGTSIRSAWWVSIAQAQVIHQTHKTQKLNSKTGWKEKERVCLGSSAFPLCQSLLFAAHGGLSSTGKAFPYQCCHRAQGFALKLLKKVKRF